MMLNGLQGTQSCCFPLPISSAIILAGASSLAVRGPGEGLTQDEATPPQDTDIDMGGASEWQISSWGGMEVSQGGPEGGAEGGIESTLIVEGGSEGGVAQRGVSQGCPSRMGQRGGLGISGGLGNQRRQIRIRRESAFRCQAVSADSPLKVILANG